MIDLTFLSILMFIFAWDGISAKLDSFKVKRARLDWDILMLAVDDLARTAAVTQEYEKGLALSMKLAAQKLEPHKKIMLKINIGNTTKLEQRFASTYQLSLENEQ